MQRTRLEFCDMTIQFESMNAYLVLIYSACEACVFSGQSHIFRLFCRDDAFLLSNYLDNICVAAPGTFELAFSDNFHFAACNNAADLAACSSCLLSHTVSPAAAPSPSNSRAQISITASLLSHFTYSNAHYSNNRTHTYFFQFVFQLAIFAGLIQTAITLNAGIPLRFVYLRFFENFHRWSRPRGLKHTHLLASTAFCVVVSSLSLGALGIPQYYSCAVLKSGAIRCWGSNDQNQLGDGTASNRQTPVAAVGLGSDIAASIALGPVRLRGIHHVLICSCVRI